MLDHEKGRFVLNVIQKSAGFTLIEMLIVVAIVALLTTLGIPSFRVWIQNTQIYTAAESAQNGLQKAKAEAVKRNSNVTFALLGASPVWDSSWIVTDATTGATVESRSGGEGSKNVTSKGLTVNPLTGVATTTQATTVTFSNLGGVVANVANLGQIDFSSSLTGTRSLRVTIGIGGNVRMCDPDTSLKTTDPRKC
jgi:type IV fimbrial biogenesis protein FimT